MFRRIIQGFLIVAISIFLLMVLTLAGIFVYVFINREEIIQRVSATINDSIDGRLVIGKINVDFLHYFPSTAVHFSDVSLQDSLFAQHKMEFFHASDVYVRLNFMELLSKEPALKDVTIKNGSIYVFKNQNGYTNSYLIPLNKNKKSSPVNQLLDEVTITSFRFVFNDQAAKKYHNIFFKSLYCGIHLGENKSTFAIKSEGIIKMLAFNLNKGSYARNASFSNDLIVYYDKVKSQLEIPEHTFYLNEKLVTAKADFNFGEKKYFSAYINASRINFSEAINMVTVKTGKLLSAYKFTRPLRVYVHAEGSLEPGSLPVVQTGLITAANSISYKKYYFSNCRMHVFYTNKSDSLMPVSPSNTEVVFKEFKGYWNGIPVNAEKARVYNFPFPDSEAIIYGTFPLRDLNNLPGGGIYVFSEGTGSYRATLSGKSDSAKWHSQYSFDIDVTNGAVTYAPRGMGFDDINAKMNISNSNVIIEHASCRSGSSFLSLKGAAPGILNTDIKDLKQSLLKWEIKSSYINLEDFTAFLGKRRKNELNKNNDQSKIKSNFGKHLERYLEACRLEMKLDIDALRFEKFTATNVKGDIGLIDDNWKLKSIRFRHAGGAVNLSASVAPVSDSYQAVSLQSSLKHVNISEVFNAFDNFSQQTVTSSHINGLLDADVNIKFYISNKASISQSSLNGIVDIKISNGELKGFQPIGKLSKFLFRKRDFTDIRFSELTNRFAARGNEIYFERMKINSSVLELYVEGSYFLDGKTDMKLQVPLSNLKNRDWNEISGDVADVGGKGMNVYINAQTDSTGELRFRYDPLKKIKDKRQRNR